MKVPEDGYTEKQLEEMRAKAVADLRKHGYGYRRIIFGCDDCNIAFRCVYVFDVYNVEGDCLAMK